MRMAVLLITLSCLTASIARAAPVINEVTASVAHADSITIVGSGFGAKTQGPPQVWDDVEDGTVDTDASIGTWGSRNVLDVAQVSRHANSHYTAHWNFVRSGTAGFQCVNNVLSRRWFVQYWVHLARNWDWGGGTYGSDDQHLSNVKFLRFWNPGSTRENFYTQFWWGLNGNSYTNPENVAGQQTKNYDNNFSKADLVLGQWHLLQFEFSDSSAAGVADGEFRMWFNGVLKEERTGFVGHTTGELKRPLFIGFFNAWGPPPDSSPNDYYLDDVYVDTSFQRVELCPGPHWDARGVCEIQIPLTWQEQSITATANVGHFAVGTTVYAYVVDAQGVANADGRALVVGNPGIDTTPPMLSELGPSGEIPCATGAAVAISLLASTNESAECRYGANGSTWAQMTPMSETGTRLHRHDVSLTCGQSYAYEVRCQDAAHNESLPGSIVFTTRAAALVTDIILDNTDSNSSSTGEWTSSTHYPGFYGVDYLYSSDATTDTFSWTTSLLQPGTYNVFGMWTADASRPNDVSYAIVHLTGTSTVDNVDQQTQGEQWVRLGSYEFGNTATISLLDSGRGTGGACADAVRISLAGQAADAGHDDGSTTFADAFGLPDIVAADDAGSSHDALSSDLRAADLRGDDAQTHDDVGGVGDAAVFDSASGGDVVVYDSAANSDAHTDSNDGDDGCQCRGGAVQGSVHALGLLLMLVGVMRRKRNVGTA